MGKTQAKKPYQYSVILRSPADRKKAIIQVERKCPECHAITGDVWSAKTYVLPDVMQWEYKCKQCGTKWVGNCYDANTMESIEPKKVKARCNKKKRKDLIENNLDEVIALAILAFVLTATVAVAVIWGCLLT